MPRKADPQTAESRQQVQRSKGSQAAVAQNFPEFFVQSAAARGVPVDQLRALVEAQIERPLLGFVGEPRVNALLLNIALDRAEPRP